MKKLVLLAFATVAFAQSAKAELQRKDVIAKSCNGEERIVADTERFYLDEEKSLIGFGAKDAQGCIVVDFYMATPTGFGTVASKTGVEKTLSYVPAMAVGRKNSCTNQVTPNEDAKFSSVTVTGNTVTLANTPDCASLVLTLKAE